MPTVRIIKPTADRHRGDVVVLSDSAADRMVRRGCGEIVENVPATPKKKKRGRPRKTEQAEPAATGRGPSVVATTSTVFASPEPAAETESD